MNLSTVNLNVLGTKAQTKVEMYRLLTVEANLFLPPQRETSIYFIREIIEGNKKALYNEKVKVISVPHIAGLRVKDMIEFIEQECDHGEEYFPSNYDEKTLN